MTNFPAPVAQLIDQAQAHLNAGRLAPAIEALRQAVGQVPANANLRTVLINFLIQNQAYDEALEHIEAGSRIGLFDDGEPAPDSDPDRLYRLGLRYRHLYVDALASPLAGALRERCARYWRWAAQSGRLDLAYLAGVTLMELGLSDEGHEMFIIGENIRDQRVKDEGLENVGLRFIMGDSSISSGIYNVPNLLTSIGIIGTLDIYIKGRELGMLPPGRAVMLLDKSEVVNRYWLDRFAPFIDIITDKDEIARLAPLSPPLEDFLTATMRVNGKHVWNNHAFAQILRRWEDEGREPLLTLPDEDLAEGWRQLQTLGPKPGDWYVCLHVRDDGFKRETADPLNKGLTNTNNADIATYRQAIEHITSLGGWVLRMGAPESAPIPFQVDRLVDYAKSPVRSQFMDVFLCGTCRFYIGTSSGLAHVPPCFGVKGVLTNWTPPYARPVYNNLFLPKLMRWQGQDRPMTFAESWRKPHGQCFRPEVYNTLGMELVNNDSQDIADAVAEMIERLAGKGRPDTPEEARRRQLYNSLPERLGIPDGGFGANSFLPQSFLNKYADLFEGIEDL
ncbi:TIGR04372 family glycosyltransferase [Magnetospirillum moscoviense]|uniref:Glycosyltransferase n=1 Tax=Magnetospirillum moscoviense TaxID=1437059 RepID=A0A178M9E7_9PROT|nr:TIGR04372 family glycosyltransferase [Magnetospirillum moscoviense]OAN45372.1 hypothetical protein A6A05_04430 [Magnetospirillum moscoviense]